MIVNPDRIEVRKAAPADYGAIRRLEEQIYALHCAGRPDIFKPGADTMPQGYFLGLLDNAGVTVLVAEDAACGRVVGFCVLKWRDVRHTPMMQPCVILHVDDFCIDAEMKRRGVGSRLFGAVKGCASQGGASIIELNVWEFNTEAAAFYESQGMGVQLRRMELCLPEADALYQTAADDVKLVLPCGEYRTQFAQMLAEFTSRHEEPLPAAVRLGDGNFDEMLRLAHRHAQGRELPEGWVPDTLWWLVRKSDNRLLGAIDIRHRLNGFLRDYGGHIGYGIRPSERRKGYATAMLALALEKCREMGMESVLILCNTSNIASLATMKRNGAVLESEGAHDGVPIQRYRIALKPQAAD
ncbi:MAG: GNAT family N-acetyltransferase [Clostridia bacterium]|nr:GNAT family N-acetyltransferase [Clostridia bacterium]